MRKRFTRLAVALCASAFGACTPSLNWRDVSPAESNATLLFPCKPDQHTRTVRLAGAEVPLTLHACKAGNVTWALAVADVADPARVGPALDALRAAAAANLGAAAPRPLPFDVAGATPNPASARLALSGKLPDGKAVDEQLALFTKGTRVYQATCVGAVLPVPDVETFFGSLRMR